MKYGVEPWYIGYISQVLDDSKVKYHHCQTWFRLFLEDGDYSIEAIKNNKMNEVVVYQGGNISWCHNTKAPIVFQGTLESFSDWLLQKKKKSEKLEFYCNSIKTLKDLLDFPLQYCLDKNSLCCDDEARKAYEIRGKELYDELQEYLPKGSVGKYEGVYTALDDICRNDL